MQQNRVETTRKKPRIIIDKSFAVFSDLNVGDTGQALLFGEIDSERKEPLGIDGVEWIVKTVKIEKIERIENKAKRN